MPSRVSENLTSLVNKPKSHKGRRVVEARQPKILEDPKNTLFLKGNNTSELITKVLKDLYSLKKPFATILQRKNPFYPFENPVDLEIITERNDCSLFLMASHTKKRPNNLVFGRTFDGKMLDLLELGVSTYVSMSEFKNDKISKSSQPCIVFLGAPFEAELNQIKNLLTDIFRGSLLRATSLSISGIEHAIVFTVDNNCNSIKLRCYKLNQGNNIRNVELRNFEEIGPRLDFTIRRSRFADDSLMKIACRQPKASKIGKVKNILHDPFKNKLGKVHIHRQNINKLQIRKRKALNKNINDVIKNKLNKLHS